MVDFLVTVLQYGVCSTGILAITLYIAGSNLQPRAKSEYLVLGEAVAKRVDLPLLAVAIEYPTENKSILKLQQDLITASYNKDLLDETINRYYEEVQLLCSLAANRKLSSEDAIAMSESQLQKRLRRKKFWYLGSPVELAPMMHKLGLKLPEMKSKPLPAEPLNLELVLTLKSNNGTITEFINSLRSHVLYADDVVKERFLDANYIVIQSLTTLTQHKKKASPEAVLKLENKIASILTHEQSLEREQADAYLEDELKLLEQSFNYDLEERVKNPAIR